MRDVLTMMDQVKRPALLIRAARLGADSYARDRHLARVLGCGESPRHAEALLRLMQKEAELNEQRRAEDAGYSLTRHLDVLIALVAEARILRASQASRARDVTGPEVS